MDITYLEGDATQPISRPAVIPHVCNDYGAWGAGFVMALSKRWDAPETAYRELAGNQGLQLGRLQVVAVEPQLWVANIIGQHGLKHRLNPTPIRYDAVQFALKHLAMFCAQQEAQVHMPRMGCGLAGGKWKHIEWIVKEELLKRDIPVFVYDYTPTTEATDDTATA